MLYNTDNCYSDQLYQDCQTKQASSTHTVVPLRYMLHNLNMQGLIDTDWETAIHISSVKSPFTLDKSGSPINLVLVVGTWALVSTCGNLENSMSGGSPFTL